jgi:hypothetical protein
MADEEKSFADQVNEAVSKLVEKDGVYEFPSDVLAELPEPVAYAAKQEKRIRDNSAAFHRANTEAKKYKQITDQLTDHVVNNATLHLSDEQRVELEDLKLTNPDAWRNKLTEYETQAREILRGKVQEIHVKGSELSELEERQAKLAAFTETTGIALTDQIIEDQLPASYSKALAARTITFDEFLTKAQAFLTKGKVVKGEKTVPVESDPDLGNLPGGNEPDAEAQDQDLLTQYQKTIF